MFNDRCFVESFAYTSDICNLTHLAQRFSHCIMYEVKLLPWGCYNLYQVQRFALLLWMITVWIIIVFRKPCLMQYLISYGKFGITTKVIRGASWVWLSTPSENQILGDIAWAEWNPKGEMSQWCFMNRWIKIVNGEASERSDSWRQQRR